MHFCFHILTLLTAEASALNFNWKVSVLPHVRLLAVYQQLVPALLYAMQQMIIQEKPDICLQF